MSRPLNCRFAWLVLCAALAPVAHAEDPASKGKFAFWDVEHLMGESCTLKTSAYGADGESTQLEIVWRPGDQYFLHRTFKVWQRGQLRIESPGTENAWTVPLDSQSPSLKNEDVQTLVGNVARGIPVLLTATPEGQPARQLSTSSERAAVSAAMFEACARSLRQHPPPKDLWLDGAFTSLESVTGCVLSRSYQIGRAALTVAIEAGPEHATISIVPIPVLFMGGRDNGRQPSIHEQKTGLRISDKSYSADVGDLFGTRVESREPAGYDITLEQLGVLEDELIQGGARKLTLKVSGEGTRRETFGGPLAVAPAAMFAACRKTKFATVH